MTPIPGRLLGIDHGRKVIGLAVSDRNGLLATPLQLLKRRSRKEDFVAIASLAEKEEAQEIIVGLPVPPPDFVGYSQANSVRLWASRLAGAVALPVRLWDETLSSVEARHLASESQQEHPERIDHLAAAVILQSYLDALRAGEATPPPVEPAQE